MLDISELLEKEPLTGSLYASDTYINGEIEFGLLESRMGSRMMALPDTFLKAIDTVLEEEIGRAKYLVKGKCGHWWGKSFYRRFTSEMSEYYQKPLTSMPMIDFLQCLRQCWKTYGWGTIDLDADAYQQGFLVVKIWNSYSASTKPKKSEPVCAMESGFLAGFFSQLTGQDLICVQTACESRGDECNYFILGLQDRVKVASTLLEEGHDHATIMQRLCAE